MRKVIRVLHIIPSTTYGGISTMLMNLYRNLDNKLIQFDFIAFNRGPLHDEIIKTGANINYINWIKKDGIRKHMRIIKKIITENGPYDVIHVHNSYKGAFALYIAKRLDIEKRICHVHTSSIETKWQKFIIGILRIIAVSNANSLIACSVSAGDFMYGNKEFKLFKNAIDTNKFLGIYDEDKLIELRRTLDISYDEKVITHIGRFSEVKNQSYILKILKQLDNKNFNYRMLFVGDGPLIQDIKTESEKLGIRSRIDFLGLRDDVNQILAITDVCLLPSHFEGLPLTVVEAQCAGVHTIVSDAVTNEVEMDLGLLTFLPINTNDIEAWGDAIIEKSYEEKREVSETIINIRNRGYDIKENIKELYKIYGVHMRGDSDGDIYIS